MAVERVLALRGFVAGALKAFVGEGWRDAHVHADEALLVKARRISHYEVVSA